jgi:RNA polymerase sigma-70 factor (ECF subfamily)
MAVQQGHRAALAELYDRHVSQMLGVAYRMLRNRRDAEDLVQDVFLEAWRRAGSYDPVRGTVRSWLLLRVRSRAIDRIRALTTARDYAMSEFTAELPEMESQDDPARSTDRERARQALGNLSDDQRLVMELGYFKGLSCREIAERCQIPVGTVKSRLASAMIKLRNQLSAAISEGSG